MESDEDSQASQDSMIVHDVQDGATPDSETYTGQQRTEQPTTNTTEFGAEWVPPWRIKAGRVPAPQSNPVSEQEPVTSWRQPTTDESAVPWRRPAATEPVSSNFNQSVPEQTSSNDYNSERPDYSYTMASLEKKNENDLPEKTPEFLATSKTSLPWSKNFGSKEDLLKPHAPIPWKSPDQSAADSDGQLSTGLVPRSGKQSLMGRSDGQRSLGLTGRDSPGAESLSSMNSTEERLEAEIMDRLEKEAQEEEAAEKRHLDVLADEMNDSNLMESSNASSIPVEQVVRNIVNIFGNNCILKARKITSKINVHLSLAETYKLY